MLVMVDLTVHNIKQNKGWSCQVRAVFRNVWLEFWSETSDLLKMRKALKTLLFPRKPRWKPDITASLLCLNGDINKENFINI